MRQKHLFGMYSELSTLTRVLLGSLPFVLIVIGYAVASSLYLDANPSGRLLPSFGQMAEKFIKLTTEVNSKSGSVIFWPDLRASLTHLGLGTLIATTVAFIVGPLVAFFPFWKSLLSSTIEYFANFIIISLMVIVMTVFGIGGEFKVAMVALGMVFILTRDIVRAAESIPSQQVTKALTLGASEYGTVIRLMMPQLVPHLLSALRIALIAGWTMLIAAEATAAQEGLGYRIIILKRRMDMAGIIPYVLVIATLSFVIDRILYYWVKRGYPWFNTE